MALSKETIADIKREYAELEARLDQLRGWQSWEDLANTLLREHPARKRGNGRATKAPAARKPKPSPSRVLQGQYLALSRNFSKRDRAKYGKLAKEKGREKAIRDMKAALKAKGAKKTQKAASNG